MILGIDASNIKDGGGITHLKEIIENKVPVKNGFTIVYVWAIASTLDQIEDRAWLKKIKLSEKYRGYFQRWFFQKYMISNEAKQLNCDVLFVPGSSFSGKFRPFVTLSQNLLPFDWNELKRYGVSKSTVRLILLFFFQSATFKKANGIIFLTNFAKDTILKKINSPFKPSIIISHGINPKFRQKPKVQQKFSKYSNDEIKILYVSFVGEYKHQWNVIRAVRKLRDQGWNLKLFLVGKLTEKKAATRLFETVHSQDPKREFVNLLSNVEYEEVQSQYKSSDLFVFASTCENLPNILIEAMAAGLPICSSHFGPMPEILRDAGVYFNPLDSNDLAEKISFLLEDKLLREHIANKAFLAAQNYTWPKASGETFAYLRDTALEFHSRRF